MFTSLIALSLLSLSLGAPAIKRNNDIDFSAVNAAPNALAREKLLGNDA